MRARAAMIGLLAAGLLPAAPAGAGELTLRAVTLSDRGGSYPAQVAVYETAAGERNAVEVRQDERGLFLRDAAGVRAPAACRRVDDTAVSCEPVAGFEARLGDLDDELLITRAPSGSVVDGGEGDDRLAGTGVLRGGAGLDELRSAGGGATLAGGPGADLLAPDAGGTLDYADHLGGVSVDLGGDEAAGEPGEGDRVLPGATGFIGGPGDDRVTAAAAGATFDGGAGDDVFTGGAGNSADGGPGDDVLTGGARYDRFEGGPGEDVLRGLGGADELFSDSRVGERERLEGGEGRDYLLGGRGRDTIDGGPGSDQITGMAGIDRLLARDSEVDFVACGDLFDDIPEPGRDVAVLDRDDEQQACGRVDRAGPPAAELLGAEAIRRAPRAAPHAVRAYVACPAARRRACAVVVRASMRGRSPSACTAEIRAGARRRFRFRVSPIRGNLAVVLTMRTRDAAGRVRRQRAEVESFRYARDRSGPAGGRISAAAARCRR